MADGRATQTLVTIFGLQTTGLFRGMVWQPFTYLFLHGGIGHIVFNMLTLWMFGADLEREWGTRHYIMSGFGGPALSERFAREVIPNV